MTRFLGNAWYMAAWSHELPDDGVLARRLLGEPQILWRASDGRAAMAVDRCPHRFVPLSRGTREGDVIRCGYHGLAFDPQGRCVDNPFGAPPAAARLRMMPVVERYGAVWFWPGDPARADSAALPDFGFLDDPAPIHRGHLKMDAGYQLIVDNLMDLSHAEFIHKESFGVNGSLLAHGKQEVTTDEAGAVWNKWDIDRAEPPAWAVPLLAAGERVDHWLHMRWNAPSLLVLSIGLARTGSERRDLVVPTMVNPHILTPETATSTHYFYTHEPTDEAAALLRKVFLEEDEPMIQAQQEAMAGRDFWDLQPVILPSDAGAIRARRKLAKLIRDEAAGESADARPVAPDLVT